MAAMVAADAGFSGVGNRKLLIRVQQMRPRGSVAVLALDIHHVRGQFRAEEPDQTLPFIELRIHILRRPVSYTHLTLPTNREV